MGLTLGGLQGVQFSVAPYLNVNGLLMAGHVADSRPPLHRGVRKALAVFACGELLDFLTTYALLHYLVAATSLKLTPPLVHEKTLHPLFYRCTNHGYHILSLEIDKSEPIFLSQPNLIVKKNSHQRAFFKGKIFEMEVSS